MGEYATRQHSGLTLQPLYQSRHIGNGVEAQTMHSRIEFDVNREALDTLALSSMNEGFEQAEGVNLGLEVVVEQRSERGHFGIHNHDTRRDTCLTQFHTFVGYGNSQIVDTMVLQ